MNMNISKFGPFEIGCNPTWVFKNFSNLLTYYINLHFSFSVPKVPLTIKRTKKGGQGTSRTSRKGEETPRIFANIVLDLVPISAPVHLSLPLAPPVVAGQRLLSTDPLVANHSLEQDQTIDSHLS